MTRAIALIDGEHYAPVVRDALAELPYEFAAAFFPTRNFWRLPCLT